MTHTELTLTEFKSSFYSGIFSSRFLNENSTANINANINSTKNIVGEACNWNNAGQANIPIVNQKKMQEWLERFYKEGALSNNHHYLAQK